MERRVERKEGVKGQGTLKGRRERVSKSGREIGKKESVERQKEREERANELLRRQNDK